MKSCLIIGLGKFGLLLGKKLMEMQCEVMVADKNEDIINEFGPSFTSAVCANCVNSEVLMGFDLPKFDTCVVAIGSDFQSSLEITANLKQPLGENVDDKENAKYRAKYVIAKANTEIQRRFLSRAGADMVVYPDRDLANSLARAIFEARHGDYEMLFNFTEVDERFSITEFEVPSEWVGKTLQDMNPRGKDRFNVLLARRGKNLIDTPGAKFVFEPGDRVIAFGETARLYAFLDKTKARVIRSAFRGGIGE